MSNDLHDEDELDAFEVEGVQAFNRMTDAMHGLDRRMGTLDAGLAAKLAAAERVASKAETAAQDAKQAAAHAHAAVRDERRSLALWASCLVAGTVIGAGAVGYWLGQTNGQKTGLADGYRIAMDEKAAAAWANTPAGKLALSLDQAGDLHALAECARPGWTVETRQGRRICFVKPDAKGSTYGWALP